MDRSQHTVTKHLNDEKTHSGFDEILFRWLNFITDQLCDVELVNSGIEHREPIFFGFFFLQYAKLRTLELYYNFFRKFCDTEKYEGLEMDTDSLSLALSEKNLEDSILPKKKQTNGKHLVRGNLQIASLRMQKATSSQELVVLLQEAW